jgi:hypothetical protein
MIQVQISAFTTSISSPAFYTHSNPSILFLHCSNTLPLSPSPIPATLDIICLQNLAHTVFDILDSSALPSSFPTARVILLDLVLLQEYRLMFWNYRYVSVS